MIRSLSWQMIFMALLSHFRTKEKKILSPFFVLFSLSHTNFLHLCIASCRSNLLCVAFENEKKKILKKMKKKSKNPNAYLFPPPSHNSCRARGLNVLPNARNCGLKFESFFMFSRNKKKNIFYFTWMVLSVWDWDKLVVYGISSCVNWMQKVILLINIKRMREQMRACEPIWYASCAALAFRRKWK